MSSFICIINDEHTQLREFCCCRVLSSVLSSLNTLVDYIIVCDPITWARERRLQARRWKPSPFAPPHLQNKEETRYIGSFTALDTKYSLHDAHRSYSCDIDGSGGRGRSNTRRLLRHVRRIVIPCPPNKNIVHISSRSSICRVSYDRRILVRPRYHVRSVQ